MYTWDDGTYLAHHGIKGQKWGLRRFQNEDGSYTNAGKERRRIFFNRVKRNVGVNDSSVLREARSKDINKLSTKELQEYNSRLQAERQFRDLTSGSLKTGRQFVDGVLKQAVTGIFVVGSIEVGKAMYVKLLKQRYGG